MGHPIDSKISKHLQEMHGQSIQDEYHFAPDSYRASAMSHDALHERHRDIDHDEPSSWNEAAEPHTHSRPVHPRFGRLGLEGQPRLTTL